MSEVCHCKSEDHTVEICIGEITRLRKEAAGFFKLLSDHCEYASTPLCHVPVSINPRPGVLICNVENCYLCNN